jgi:hypothetical protein
MRPVLTRMAHLWHTSEVLERVVRNPLVESMKGDIAVDQVAALSLQPAALDRLTPLETDPIPEMHANLQFAMDTISGRKWLSRRARA